LILSGTHGRKKVIKKKGMRISRTGQWGKKGRKERTGLRGGWGRNGKRKKMTINSGVNSAEGAA